MYRQDSKKNKMKIELYNRAVKAREEQVTEKLTENNSFEKPCYARSHNLGKIKIQILYNQVLCKLLVK